MARRRWRLAAVLAVLAGLVVVPFVRNALADTSVPDGGGWAHAGAGPGAWAQGMTSAAAVPSGYSVTGIDVSSWNHTMGNIDWAGLAASGTKFAYIKATEATANTWYVNPYFGGDSAHEPDYQAARNAGLSVGAYAFGRPDLGVPAKQADFLVDHALWTVDSQTLIPFLDIEWPPGSLKLPDCWNLTPTQMVAWIRAFVAQVATRIGRKPMIYTAASWWNQCTGSDTSFGDYPLDVACYTTNPACASPILPAGWSTFAIWQYAGGNINQVGNYDKDVVNGDITALKALAGPTPPVVVSLHAHANGRIVTAEGAGAQPLIANRTGIGTWERFDEVDLGGGNVALRSHANGQFVTAENAGAQPLIANRMAAGSWETFQLVHNPDGSVSFKAHANGRYVTADNAGAKSLIANRTAVGPWEEFDLVPPPKTVSLRAHANNAYVTAENAGALPLIANRTAIGSWERFAVYDLGNGHLALLAQADGKFVTAESAGTKPLIANRLGAGPWETFTLVTNADQSVSLRADANGHYVTAENAGALPLIANRTAIGPWEEFDLT